jgi:hypothetical protein
MQNPNKKNIKNDDKIKLLDSIDKKEKEKEKEKEQLEEDEKTKLNNDYKRLLKMDEEEHLTHLTRCIKCGKKIEMYTYFCNSTCDDEFIKEKEGEK